MSEKEDEEYSIALFDISNSNVNSVFV